MDSKVQDAKQRLAELVGEEGPPMALFIEFAAGYGLPIHDGKVPLSTELNVMMQKWRVLLLDESKAGFAGAIGFGKILHGRLASFGLWTRVPNGAEDGYLHVGDDSPLVEVNAGAAALSIGSIRMQLTTFINMNKNPYVWREHGHDTNVWSMVRDILSRTILLASRFDYLECSIDDLK